MLIEVTAVLIKAHPFFPHTCEGFSDIGITFCYAFHAARQAMFVASNDSSATLSLRQIVSVAVQRLT